MKITQLLLAALLAAPASAQLDKLKLPDAVQSVKLGGDLRLRNDVSRKRGPNLTRRARLRFLLRYGLEAELPDQFGVVFRAASGTGEQVSSNQSYDNLGSQKGLWIDLAYARWRPRPHEAATIQLSGGRLVNPLWRIGSSDLIFDADFNPEGFGESIEWLFADAGVSAFANGLQAVADEDSTSGKNQWLFSSQLGAETRLPFDGRLRVAAAYHKWSDENRSSFGQTAVQDGNRRSSSGVLLNKFGVGELTAQVSSWAGDVPLSFQATLARNFAARLEGPATVNGTTTSGPLARDGYQFGAVLGSAKSKGKWEAAYFKKYAQSDVTVADVADSDFGDGGTNRQGHIVWLAYAPRDWMQLKAKAFFTDVVDRGLSPGDKAINRFQTDFSLKF